MGIGTLYNWSGIYPVNQDGYKLFERLDAGNPVEITVKGTRFKLQFQGDRYGGNNMLLVTDENGKKRKYGWGWESGLVFEALEEMQIGWDRPRTYQYRPMQGVTQVEAV
jgi:hypothetical protein